MAGTLCVMEKRPKRNRTRLSIVLALAMLLSLCMIKTGSITVCAASLPDRAGSGSTTDITMKEFTIAVPSYWQSDTYDASDYRAYVYDDSFAMLLVSVYDGMTGYSFANDEERNLFLASMYSAMGDVTTIESGYKKIGSFDGAYSSFNTVIEGIDVKGTVFCTIDGDICYCYMLAESTGNKYDYQPDFFKTIQSSHKASGAPEAQPEVAAPAEDAAAPEAQSEAAPPEEQSEPAGDDMAGFTDAQKKIVNDARMYMTIKAYSKAGLIEQLSSELGSGYPLEDATKAVEYIEKADSIDWNEQAVKCAQTYMDVMTMTKDQLLLVLTSDVGAKFTQEQAEYAVSKLGF